MTPKPTAPADPNTIDTPSQRITITLDILDEPGNDTIAVGALHTLIRHLGYDDITPHLIRLEIQPAPTT